MVVESRDLFAAACLVFGIAMVMLKLHYGPGARQRKAVTSPTIGRGWIVVSGLTAAQVEAILADFAKLYDLPAATFAVKGAGAVVQVSWTRPITTDIALFLVNFLTYPADQTLPDAQPLAVGVIPVPAGIAPDGVAADTLAKIFVPEGDTEHDLVHALVEDGRAFRISFTRMKWQSVTRPQTPAFAARVAFALEG
ncbi:hypothetical protein A9D12_01905 [Erythrobacter neustonensis]|uniref:Uncharacterized protein n=1 Tax=Erythrobacter neustonensis TaxID=1112 RepID=A0A192D1S9_9SPHN|nr:hypothetical protein A9D12_01905 [Erythrobacter neustonensis]